MKIKLPQNIYIFQIHDMAENIELVTASLQSTSKDEERTLTHHEAMEITKKSLAEIISVSLQETGYIWWIFQHFYKGNNFCDSYLLSCAPSPF